MKFISQNLIFSGNNPGLHSPAIGSNGDKVVQKDILFISPASRALDF